MWKRSRTIARDVGVGGLRAGWSITDEALTQLDQHLARPEPERGALLVGPPEQRLITGIVADPVPGQGVAYYHSDQVRELLRETLAGDVALTYRGTAHSHPAGFAVPSGPDQDAFASSLTRNESLSELLFPIVVNRRVEQLHRDYRGEHLLSVPHGTIAGFSASRGEGRLRLGRAPLTVLPVRALADGVSDAVGWPAAVIRVVEGPAGLPFLLVSWPVEGEPCAEVLLPPGYPLTAPLARRGQRSRFESGTWVLGEDPVHQVLATLDCRTVEQGADADHPVERVGSPGTIEGPSARQLFARLEHHLPERADWWVAVLGSGSVGSVIAEALARSGVQRLELVDPDVVEPANLSRTVYTSLDLGRPKAEALRDRLRAINPSASVGASVSDIDGWLRDLDELPDLVVLATDDSAAEAAVNQELFGRSVPLLSVKMFARADAGEIVIVSEPAGTRCLLCQTGAPAAPVGREVDYGSGRLVAELALGPDIAGVAHKATKIALALLAQDLDGVLARWLRPALASGRTRIITNNVAGWEVFGHLNAGEVGLDGPYQTLWIPMADAGNPGDCPVCRPAGPVDRDEGGASLIPSGEPPELADQ